MCAVKGAGMSLTQDQLGIRLYFNSLKSGVRMVNTASGSWLPHTKEGREHRWEVSQWVIDRT